MVQEGDETVAFFKASKVHNSWRVMDMHQEGLQLWIQFVDLLNYNELQDAKWLDRNPRWLTFEASEAEIS